MKKSLFSLLAVALMASAANAATIGLQWAANPGDSNSDGGGVVNLAVSTLQGDVIGGIIFEFNDVPNVILSNTTTDLPGWGVGGAGGPLGQGAQVSLGAVGGSEIQGAGSVIAATFELSVDGPYDGTQKAITFDVAANVAGVLDAAGGRMLWDARYNTSYSGYIAYGDFGNPGWGTKTAMGHQPTANPLFLTKIPEPSSLALIALGGFALLRRSR